MNHLIYLQLIILVFTGCGVGTQKPNIKQNQKVDSINIQSYLNDLEAKRKENTKIKGFGKLKLWESTNVITTGQKIIPIKTSTEYMNRVYQKTKGSIIYELIYDTKDAILGLESDKRVRTFCIANYQITDQIKLEAVTLKYYNDSLFSIECNQCIDLDNALTVKYGEPEVKLDRKGSDKTYKTEWDTDNMDVICRSVLDIWQDPINYKESSLNYTYLMDMSYFKKVRESESLVKKAEKESKSKDF